MATTLLLLPWESVAYGGFFSIDAASPSASLVSNSDALVSGPVGGPPDVGAALIFAGDPIDELNGMSIFTGSVQGFVLYFSVDRASVGASSLRPGVLSESAHGQHAGDVYWTRMSGWNRLGFNQHLLGELPALGHGAAVSPPIDNIDALEANAILGFPIFALAPGHPRTGLSGQAGCGGDLFGSGGPANTHSYANLGLASCADDVDALHSTFPAGDIYYSLAPGSPSLLPGSPILGCSLGCSAADIFVRRAGSSQAEIFATASDLGLLPSDNVDAMTFFVAPPPITPVNAPALGWFAQGTLALLLAASPLLSRRRACRSESGIPYAMSDAYQPDQVDFYLGDPFAHWKRLRAEAPVHWYQPLDSSKEGFWCVLRHKDLQEVSRRPKRFASGHGSQLFEVGAVGPVEDGGLEFAGSIIRLDPPEHNRHRKLVMPSFTPQQIERLAPRIREIARESLDAISAGATVDYVAQAAVPLPMLVIAELLGVPTDRLQDFRRWSDAVVEVGGGSIDERSAHAMGELMEYFRGEVAGHSQAPRDDLVSRIAQSEIDGERLTDQDMVMFCITLLVAGNETTRNLISTGTLALLQHPEQCAAIQADAALIPNAVEEMLRWQTPVQTFIRRALEDCELGGEKIKRGDFVALFYGSANRDETVFGPNAETFDIRREDARRHVAFGFGEHLCLGASLARLEAKIFFEEIRPRLAGLELQGEPQWLPSVLMHGVASMPIRFAN